MIEKISEFSKEFLEKTDKKEIKIISHFDTDGITSAAIFGRALKRLDKKFSFIILKGLETEFFKDPQKAEVLVFLDLASNSLNEIEKLNKLVFIIDHHEINKNHVLPENIKVLNPHLCNGEEISSSCLTYLVSKEIAKKDIKSANLAIIGMVGDILEKKQSPLINSIIKDSEVTLKKGLLLYPSTRPLNKTLEYCSNPYIPGVTGNYEGVLSILRDAEIPFTEKGYKPLIDLTEEEMQKLVTAITLRLPNHDKITEFIGNLYLIKNNTAIEDAREISALINACSRMGESNIALLLCMGNESMRKKAEEVYIRYKQNLIQALNHIQNNPKIQGNQYVIVNAKDKIQDTIIGTVASIMSMSALYKEGTVIITMAYNQDKIKVSSRLCGREKIENSLNLRDLMNQVTELLGGESGGHKMAAGCIISKDKEQAFIELVKKKLEFEVVKV